MKKIWGENGSEERSMFTTIYSKIQKHYTPNKPAQLNIALQKRASKVVLDKYL